MMGDALKKACIDAFVKALSYVLVLDKNGRELAKLPFFDVNATYQDGVSSIEPPDERLARSSGKASKIAFYDVNNTLLFEMEIEEQNVYTGGIVALGVIEIRWQT